jgi:hypothetical protein
MFQAAIGARDPAVCGELPMSEIRNEAELQRLWQTACNSGFEFCIGLPHRFAAAFRKVIMQRRGPRLGVQIARAHQHRVRVRIAYRDF